MISRPWIERILTTLAAGLIAGGVSGYVTGQVNQARINDMQVQIQTLNGNLQELSSREGMHYDALSERMDNLADTIVKRGY